MISMCGALSACSKNKYINYLDFLKCFKRLLVYFVR